MNIFDYFYDGRGVAKFDAQNPMNKLVDPLSKMTVWMNIANVKTTPAMPNGVEIPLVSARPADAARSLVNRPMTGSYGRVDKKFLGMTEFDQSTVEDYRAFDNRADYLAHLEAYAQMYLRSLMEQMDRHFFTGDMHMRGGESVGLLDYVSDTSQPNVLKTGIANSSTSEYYSIIVVQNMFNEGVFTISPNEAYWADLFAGTGNIEQYYTDASGTFAIAYVQKNLQQTIVDDSNKRAAIQGGAVVMARMGMGIGDPRSIQRIVNIKKGWWKDEGETNQVIDTLGKALSQLPVVGGNEVLLMGDRSAWNDIFGHAFDGNKVRYFGGAGSNVQNVMDQARMAAVPFVVSDHIPALGFVA